MPVKQIYKKIKMGVKAPIKSGVKPTLETVVKPNKATRKNKVEKLDNDMTTEQLEKMETLAQEINVPKSVKVVKKDRGLIERTESSKIVLTEDNRQVLND